MSKLDAIHERVGGSKGDLPATENFALLVSGYGKDAKNRDTINGLRLDTGDEVTVVLRPYKGKEPLKAPRAEVKDFVAAEGEVSTPMRALPEEMRRQLLKGMKAKTEPGGTIIVQRGYLEKATGIINAGWLQSAAKYAEHAQVTPNVMVRVALHKKRDEQEYSSVSATAISPERAQLVKSEDELKVALRSAYEGVEGIHGRPMVLIRISEAGGAKAIEDPIPRKVNPEFGKQAGVPEYLQATPGQAVRMFLETANGKGIASLVGDPDVQIEVIPGTQVYLGSQSRASFENRAEGLSAANANYRFAKSEKDESGFTPSYLVLHSVGENAHVYSAAEPLSNKPALFHSRDIATAYYKGKPTAVLENKEVTTHTVAAEDSAPAGTAPDEDEEFEIGAVVAAAISPEVVAPRPRA